LNAVLLDTNILSYALKHDTRYEAYREYVDESQPTLSFMTIAELYRWAEARNWGTRRRSRLGELISRFRVVHSDEPMCRHWSHVVAQCQRAGRRISTTDAWVAAAALRHGLPLVTHNVKDFKPISELTILTADSDA